MLLTWRANTTDGQRQKTDNDRISVGTEMREQLAVTPPHVRLQSPLWVLRFTYRSLVCDDELAHPTRIVLEIMRRRPQRGGNEGEGP